MKTKEKSVLIVNCFKAWEGRVILISKYFSNNGYKVKILHSDFDHMKKVHYKIEDKKYTMIHTLPYKKNMSIKRILSHWFFAKKFYKAAKDTEHQILYVLAPPNSLIKEAARLKKKMNQLFVVDIIDMWPESMPIEKFKDNILFKYWANLRNCNINTADKVITECSYYKEILGRKIDIKKHNTLYWAHGKELQYISQNNNIDTLELVYLGSINNIIDIDLIVDLLKEITIYKSVNLHIIGDGENKETLLRKLNENNLSYYYHGKIYEQSKKSEILAKCHFALNIMKPNVTVGLTMKSIDYFQNSLPIINTIPGDTSEFVINDGIGINISSESIVSDVRKIISIPINELEAMRNNVKKLYVKNFSEDAFLLRIGEIMDSK